MDCCDRGSSAAAAVLVALLATVCAVGAQGATPATPPGDTARAKALYLEAERHYMLAEYDAAIEKYKVAYRLRAEPTFLFNIAQACRKAGRTAEALEFYRNYLAAAPDASNRDQVERFISDLDAALKTAAAPPAEAARGVHSVETASPAAVLPPATLPATSPLAPAPAPPRSRSGKGLWIGLGASALVVVGGGIALAVWLSTRPSGQPWIADYTPF